HGASGGVGSAAVQMARAMGLTVLGTAGTQKGADLVKREGAHQVFDHSKAGYQEEIMKAAGGRGVDVILEMLANVNLSSVLKLRAPTGKSSSPALPGKSCSSPEGAFRQRTQSRSVTADQDVRLHSDQGLAV